ncbi:MAG: hypothetical protein LBG65_02150 [Puniceicoccales bacterium]|nr:hypothetical protein [Puniceicoccales bacterium]
MKKQIPIFLSSLLVFFAFVSIAALHGAVIPEPILPLREAGEYVPRIEELRNALKEDDMGESFSRKLHRLFAEISEKRRARLKDGRSRLFVSTRSEFVALEWACYQTLFLPFPDPNRLWEWAWNAKFIHFFGDSAFASDRLSAESAEFLAREKIDPRKLHHLRATYRALFLKRMRQVSEEFAEEKLAVDIGIRRLERANSRFRNNIEKNLNPKTKTKEEVSDWKREEASLWNAKCRIDNFALHSSKDRVESEEDDFFYYLLLHFGDKPASIEPYLKLAGYDSESKRAGLLLCMQKSALRDMSKDRLFSPYAKKTRFNPDLAKRLAKIEEDRVAKELALREKKWKARHSALSEEYEDLSKKIAVQREALQEKQKPSKVDEPLYPIWVN